MAGGGGTGVVRVREKNLGRGLAYTLAVMVFTVVMVQWVLPSVLGGITKRPEGAAYRFLNAVGTEEAEEVERFGDPNLVAELTDFKRFDDGDWFERVEVGRGVAIAGTDGTAVPVLVVRRDVKEPDKRTTLRLAARVVQDGDGWRVVDVADRPQPNMETPTDDWTRARVPSEGGEFPARAPLSAWVIALLVGVGLTALATVILKAAPEPGTMSHL